MSFKTNYRTGSIDTTSPPEDDPNATPPTDARIYSRQPSWSRGVLFRSDQTGGTSLDVEVWGFDSKGGNTRWGLLRTFQASDSTQINPDEFYEVLGSRDMDIFFRVIARTGAVTAAEFHAGPQVGG